MSASRPFVRQTLVPVLGFIALVLFLLNFFTYLSHALPYSIEAHHMCQVEAPNVVHPAPFPPGLDAEMRALEIKLRTLPLRHCRHASPFRSGRFPGNAS